MQFCQGGLARTCRQRGCTGILIYTVKPLNKGHVGDNINLHALSLVERLSSSRRFKLYCYYIYIGKQNFRVP